MSYGPSPLRRSLQAIRILRAQEEANRQFHENSEDPTPRRGRHRAGYEEAINHPLVRRAVELLDGEVVRVERVKPGA